MYLDQTMVRYERTISLKLGFYFVVERRLPSNFGVSLLLHGGFLLPDGGFSPFVVFPSLIFNHLSHPSLLDSCHYPTFNLHHIFFSLRQQPRGARCRKSKSIFTSQWVKASEQPTSKKISIRTSTTRSF